MNAFCYEYHISNKNLRGQTEKYRVSRFLMELQLHCQFNRSLFHFHRRFAGFDVMTLANNHLNDYGDVPVNYTINALKEVGIKAVGVSYGPYNSRQVIQTTKPDKTIKEEIDLASLKNFLPTFFN